MSREQALATGSMKKDNTSRAVIAATRAENQKYGRLYFRPLTPTQYHNEGYKPEGVRDRNINVSCPVPVFLCLDSVMILNYPDTKFAEMGMSGNRHNIKEGVEEFSKLNFAKIYHDGPYGESERDIKEYRHSEIIHDDGFPVEPYLRCILCRTLAEKETLLYLIQLKSLRMYNSYKNRIFYKPTLKCFNSNGIFLKNVYIFNGTLKMDFNDPEQRYLYRNTDVYFTLSVELSYIKRNGRVLYIENGISEFNYGKVRSAEMNLREDILYDFLRVKINFDEETMYENEIDVWSGELF